jgi:predicted metal-dependent phosphoesterase TrpH
MTVRVDFHVHTRYSPDSVITFESLVSACRERSLDAVAIMDHDVIEGAFEFKARAEEMRRKGEWAPRVLVGEEVRSTGGEICGLFLKEWVPDHMPPLETMEAIRSQGGLVYVPHPFDLLKLKRLRSRELVELSDRIDIIEVFNGKPRFPAANILARRFQARNDFAVSAAGSDAHEPTHLGAAFVEMEDFSGPEDLLGRLPAGTIEGHMYCPFASAYIRFKMRKMRKR